MRAVDSSLLVKYFSREEGWRQARKVLLEGAVTLDLAVKEVGNALWKKVVSGEMRLEDAKRVVEDLASGETVKLYDQHALLGKALEVAVKHRVTIYDALFIVLAEELGLELASSDRLQARVAEERGVKVMLIP